MGKLKRRTKNQWKEIRRKEEKNGYMCVFFTIVGWLSHFTFSSIHAFDVCGDSSNNACNKCNETSFRMRVFIYWHFFFDLFEKPIDQRQPAPIIICYIDINILYSNWPAHGNDMSIQIERIYLTIDLNFRRWHFSIACVEFLRSF